MSISIANIDNAVDSNDVTLALCDTRVNPEHKMVLAAANPPVVQMKSKADLDSTSSQEVLKPSSTLIIPDLPAATVGSITLPHQLNHDNIQQKLVNNLSLPMMETKTNKNDTKSIQFNPGSFYIVAISLFREWIMLLESQNLDIVLSGIPLTLINGANHLDKGGSKERSLIRLSSEFGQITVTFYNTTHKITIQGNKQAVDLFDSALDPFINKQLVEKSNEINNFNNNLNQQTNRPPLPPPTSPTLTAARTPLPLSPPSPTNRHPPLALEVDSCSPLRKIDLTKSQIVPDDIFLHSLQEAPTDDEEDFENSFTLEIETVEKQRVETQDKQLPTNPTRKSVIVLAKQAEGELGGGVGNQVVSSQGVSLVGNSTNSSPTEHIFPKVITTETTDDDEVVLVEDERPYQCGTCAKTFKDEASVNAHIETHKKSDLEKRMEKLEKTMEIERRANNYKIELLEHKVAALESQLRRTRQGLPPTRATLIVARAPNLN